MKIDNLKFYSVVLDKPIFEGTGKLFDKKYQITKSERTALHIVNGVDSIYKFTYELDNFYKDRFDVKLNTSITIFDENDTPYYSKIWVYLTPVDRFNLKRMFEPILSKAIWEFIKWALAIAIGTAIGICVTNYLPANRNGNSDNHINNPSVKAK